MKYPGLILMLVLSYFNVLMLYSQELVKKKKYKNGLTTEFFVLKDNKDLKHGSVLSNYTDILGKKYIVDFGQYDYGKKSGEWLSFYYHDPNNSLMSRGRFFEDKKQGLWKYYYPAKGSNDIKVFFGSEKRTNIRPIKKGEYRFQIEVDTTAQQLSCVGEYQADKMIGVWDYYHSSGYILHRYDYDSNRLLENTSVYPGSDFLIYLGGPDRFLNNYYIAQQEMKDKEAIQITSEVVFEVLTDGQYKLISAYGDEIFKSQIEKALTMIPNDWKTVDASASKRLQVAFKMAVNSSFVRNSSLVEFKVVE